MCPNIYYNFIPDSWGEVSSWELREAESRESERGWGGPAGPAVQAEELQACCLAWALMRTDWTVETGD